MKKDILFKNISKDGSLIIGLALLKLVIHFLTNTNYELHRDAFLYYSLGENLDWGYLSVPPLIAVLSKISVFLFGKTVFALRFFPALIGSVSVILIAKIIKKLNGGSWAIIIAASAFIFSPAFLRSNTLFQPVSFNQFFWLLLAYQVIRLLKSGNPKTWISVFIVLGLAFLTKYSISFIAFSFFIALALTEHRILYKSKYFIIGGVLGLLIILPNLLWQYQHNWPVITHMSELQKYQFVNVSIAGFLIGQLIMNLPGLIIWITGLITFLFFKAEKKYRLLAYMYLFTLFIILLLQGKSYYTLGLYPVLFALGGYAIEKYAKPYLRVAVLAIMFLISIPMLPLSLPIYSHEELENFTKKTAEFTNRWEDGEVHNLPQDYADMIGWKELADIVIDTYKYLPENSKKQCLIYAEEYCTAGAILFYGKEIGLPEPICFNDNFLLWAPDSIKSDVLIYVNDEKKDIEWAFENIELKGQVNNKYFRENGVKVYLFTHANDTFPSFYANKVAALKKRYR